MTSEKAIEWIKYHINITPYEDTDELKIALDMAIKALEKESILDKIRAEIMELDTKVCQQFLIEDVDKEVHRTYRECIDIIDKYKTESEE